MDKMLKAPFFKLLLPLVVGIVIQYYCYIGKWSILPTIIGLGVMLFSYFDTKPEVLHRRLWFGYGLCGVLVGIGMVSTMLRQEMSRFVFPDVSQVYTGVVVDLPHEKPNSYAYTVKLKESDKLIVCYFLKQDTLKRLGAGDTFTFFSQIQKFENRPTLDGFDYTRYMYNKGYAGTTFVSPNRWQKEKETHRNLFVEAAQSRQWLLRWYKSFDLKPDEYAMLSALTLGYTDNLSDDVVDTFRTTGVAHILAVSGMHVGVIFAAFSILLGFVSRHSRFYWLKQLLIIIGLWTYLFIIGFPPSALRACIMLTAYCISLMLRLRNYSFNTLFMTAFLMLVWNPLWLFDVGFQLSFTAVLSMLVLMPAVSDFLPVRNRLVTYFRDILSVSLSVQIGIFPLCLYYFGTFPVYFFIANLAIIPLITVALYSGVLLLFLGWVGGVFSYLPIFVFKQMAKGTFAVSSFFEQLPYALLQDMKPSFVGLVLLWMVVVSIISFTGTKKPKALIVSLIGVLILIGMGIKTSIDNRDTLTVYPSPQSTRIQYQVGFYKEKINGVENNRLIWMKGSTYLIVAKDTWKGKYPSRKMKINYLQPIENNSLSLYSLSQVFEIDRVVLDGSLSKKTLQRFVLECEKLRISYYDVSQNGVLRIFF